MADRTLSFLLTVSLFAIFPFFSDPSTTAKTLIVATTTLVIYLFVKQLSIPIHASLLSCALIVVYAISSWGTVGQYSIFALILAFLLFLLVYNFYSFDSFCCVVSVLVTIVSLLGVYEYFSFRLLGPSREMLIPWILPRDSSYRIGGVVGQPNLFAAFLLASVFPFIFYYYNHVGKIRNALLKKISLAPFGVVFLCFFWTFSRSVFLAYLCLVLLFFFFRKKISTILSHDEFRVLYSVFFVSLGCFVLSLLVDHCFSTSVNRLAANMGGFSIVSRFVLWLSGFLMFKDNLFYGVGLHNYRLYLDDYLIPVHDMLKFVLYRDFPYTDWAHNEFIQLIAEGGVLALLIIACALYFFIKSFLENRDRESYYLFLVLFVLIFHSMFSWTLRHPTLFVLFIFACGLLLKKKNIRCVSFSVGGLSKIFIGAGIVFVLYVGSSEYQYYKFFAEVRTGNLNIAKFENLYVNDYVRFELLQKSLPVILKNVLQEKDVTKLKWLSPYLKEIATIQGADWQWYNYSLAILICGDRVEARKAIENALHTAPLNEKYWAFLHYINILNLSESRGVGLEYFFHEDSESMDVSSFLDSLGPIGLMSDD
ncbi:O-antigen ligase family protein [Desulfuromonas acetoxidans]|uniref:O-antigen ligase family protein n=1 Tax=Desulfuromonas acetoxidans TaxID=891 RepID=UPI00292EFA49|nr:O-antigen ligase family protein [Desulfuromonas acetoxidans]